MGVKLYISGISGNQDVKKKQQRVMMILDSKTVDYEIIDITEPGRESDKEFMQQNSTAKSGKHPLPPQIFNDEEYCGDFDEFDTANENDGLLKFLKLSGENDIDSTSVNSVRQNGNQSSREASTDKDMSVGLSESETHTTVENNREEKSKSPEADESANSIADGDDIEGSADKNEEKSDDQEKEE